MRVWRSATTGTPSARSVAHDPARVLRDLDHPEMRGSLPDLASWDLGGKVVWFSTCHSGEPTRTAVWGDVVSTFGDTGRLVRFHDLGPGESLCTAILARAPAAFLAPVGPNHGWLALVERRRAVRERLSLGETIRRGQAEVALADRAYGGIPLVLQTEGRPEAAPPFEGAVMRENVLNRVLYGDRSSDRSRRFAESAAVVDRAEGGSAVAGFDLRLRIERGRPRVVGFVPRARAGRHVVAIRASLTARGRVRAVQGSRAVRQWAIERRRGQPPSSWLTNAALLPDRRDHRLIAGKTILLRVTTAAAGQEGRGRGPPGRAAVRAAGGARGAFSRCGPTGRGRSAGLWSHGANPDASNPVPWPAVAAGRGRRSSGDRRSDAPASAHRSARCSHDRHPARLPRRRGRGPRPRARGPRRVHGARGHVRALHAHGAHRRHRPDDRRHVGRVDPRERRRADARPRVRALRPQVGREHGVGPRGPVRSGEGRARRGHARGRSQGRGARGPAAAGAREVVAHLGLDRDARDGARGRRPPARTAGRRRLRSGPGRGHRVVRPGRITCAPRRTSRLQQSGSGRRGARDWPRRWRRGSGHCPSSPARPPPCFPAGGSGHFFVTMPPADLGALAGDAVVTSTTSTRGPRAR
jgi:hypothetical protein